MNSIAVATGTISRATYSTQPPASNAQRIAAWERVTDRESEESLRRQVAGIHALREMRERWAGVPRHKSMVVV